MIKRQRWKPYVRKAKSIELNVKDNQEQTIDFFKIYKGKTRDTERILEKLKKKYEFDLKENKEIEEVKEEKKDWLEKSMKW